ncbi:hypothetical protein KFU94_42175 [Chloroflexi bacterium TSY]|nr:hypothetical protein [Chloroflexi bacterium TSY]
MTTVTLEVPDYLVPMIDDLQDQLPIVLEMGMSRFAPVSTQAYVEVISLLAQSPSAEAITTFRFSEEVEMRIKELLDKNKEDRLSMAEKVELDRLVQLEEQVILVKAKARALLSPA